MRKGAAPSRRNPLSSALPRVRAPESGTPALAQSIPRGRRPARRQHHQPGGGVVPDRGEDAAVHVRGAPDPAVGHVGSADGRAGALLSPSQPPHLIACAPRNQSRGGAAGTAEAPPRMWSHPSGTAEALSSETKAPQCAARAPRAARRGRRRAHRGCRRPQWRPLPPSSALLKLLQSSLSGERRHPANGDPPRTATPRKGRHPANSDPPRTATSCEQRHPANGDSLGTATSCERRHPANGDIL
eukprot:gene11775-biopygen2161